MLLCNVTIVNERLWLSSKTNILRRISTASNKIENSFNVLHLVKNNYDQKCALPLAIFGYFDLKVPVEASNKRLIYAFFIN